MHIFEEDDLLNMVQHAPIGICILDAATLKAEVVNDKFLEVAGKPYEAVFDKWYWEPFAEARPYYEEALSNVVLTGEAYYANEVELMLIRHGREEWVFVTFVYHPVKNKDGRVTKVAVWVLENTQQVKSRQVISDLNEQLAAYNQEQVAINEELTTANEELVDSITELSEAKRYLQQLNSELQVRTVQLSESETRFRNLIQASPVALLVTRGEDMIFEEFNEATLDMIGKDWSVKGKPWFEALPNSKGKRC